MRSPIRYRVKVEVENGVVLRVRVAQGGERSTIRPHMALPVENCPHLEGLKVAIRSEYRCPLCGKIMDLAGVAGWVREAEMSRDEAYSMVEGDGFGEIAREESQREVYRRRRVMYELENVPRVVTARPEMILVVHDGGKAAYECRVFYKAPRPVGVVEQASIEATTERILELRSDADPVVRLISEKVEEFHAFRSRLVEDGEPAPERRVFYANEL